jgi:hypothetical protein
LTELKIEAARSKLITGNHLGASCTPTRHRRSSNVSNAADYSSPATQMYDSSSGLQHGNLGFEVGCSKLEFLWDPYLNSSALQNEIVSSGSSSQKNFPLQLKGPQRSIVVGGGLWHARHLGEDCCAQQTGVHGIGCGSTAYSLFYLGSELILMDIRKPYRSSTCLVRYSGSLPS